jgi:hypothetical protein
VAALGGFDTKKHGKPTANEDFLSEKQPAPVYPPEHARAGRRVLFHQNTYHTMKLTHLFTAAVAALALVVPASAQDETPLGKEMEKISKSLKLVNRNLADVTQKESNLAKIAEAKAACEKAAGMEPAKTKDVPAAEKAKFLEEYKASMVEMGKQLDELKAAISADKSEDAAKVMEKLNAGKKDGHKKYKKED